MWSRVKPLKGMGCSTPPMIKMRTSLESFLGCSYIGRSILRAWHTKCSSLGVIFILRSYAIYTTFFRRDHYSIMDMPRPISSTFPGNYASRPSKGIILFSLLSVAKSLPHVLHHGPKYERNSKFVLKIYDQYKTFFKIHTNEVIKLNGISWQCVISKPTNLKIT